MDERRQMRFVLRLEVRVAEGSWRESADSVSGGTDGETLLA